MRDSESMIEGKNAVIEAFRAGTTIDRLFVLENDKSGPVNTIIREAKKSGVPVKFVKKQRLDQLSETGAHQGVIAYISHVEYADIDDILDKAASKNEPPFIFLLDGIEDPHNLGAIIRTADASGAHGVVITKNRSADVTSTVVKASAGAVNHVAIAKVTNLTDTIEGLKDKGMWFVCADADGDVMYNLNLTGAIGLVIGNEGHGVSRLVREHCDMTASIPMKGQISSLNASVAAGVLSYEIVRQRSLNE